MSQLNQRKEPTFGEPSEPKLDKVENAEKSAENTEKPKVILSLHSKGTVGHTFTPVMKRSSDNVDLPTLEEQKALKEKENVSEPAKKANGGFAFSPVAETNNDVQPQPEAAAATQQDAEPEKTAANPIERVIPAAAPAAAKAVVEKVPSKYRRLLIVLLLLLALLLVFFLLKPKTPESVETLQQQGSSLPIEFRPVDEEEAKRAEAQAKAAQEAALVQKQAEAQNQQAQQAVGSQAQIANPQSAAQPAENTAQQPAVQQQTQSTATQSQEPQVVGVAKPAEQKPTVQEPAKKPTNTGSVIYQPEQKQPAKTTAVQPKTTPPTAKVETKAQPKVDLAKGAPVVKAEPVKVATPAASVSSKTMTVPKGVSLMQVFRDNNLNIADVNAMSKANGVVSQLKAGEKVTVRLDKDNRVTEMSIGSGGKFIRQANGTYIYK
ncbi:hypothetical protein A1D29_00250 [Pasteurellaceae bacterium Orientalotternb1]|nr:hypothetical protein A1D29_00250 [Pasteurellaceae bacterium Orientalotternb1]